MKTNNISGFRKYLQDIFYVITEKGVSLLFRFFVSVWLIRYLGPDQFGAYSYAISLVVLFMSISTLGVDNILVRELVKRRDERDVLMGSAFVLKLFGAIFSFLLLFFTHTCFWYHRI